MQIIPNSYARISVAGACAVAACVAMPIIVVLVALVLPAGADWAHIRQNTLLPYVLNSTALMIMTGVIAALSGVATAWCVTSCNFPGRTLLSWLLVMPLSIPAYVLAYIYADILAYSGPLRSGLKAVFGDNFADIVPNIRNLPGASLVLALALYPYVYLLARVSFETRAGQAFNAARVLGKTPLVAFWTVALPCARPAVWGGLALVLMETLADFGVADYFAIPTFSTGIFKTWLGMGETLTAMKLAGVMLLFVMVLVLMELFSRRGRYYPSGHDHTTPVRFQLSKGQQYLATGLCVFPVLLGFVIPLARLVYLSVASGDNFFGADFVAFVVNSLKLGLISAILATLIAVYLAYIQRQQAGTVSTIVIRLSTLGYALPGALLAVGLLGPVLDIDRYITGVLKAHYNRDVGLVLTGSLIVLIYACVVRFLTVSFNTITATFSKIPPSMDEAARSLGSTPFRLVREIHLPLLRPAITAATCLVFIDVLRELPATLILRPFNFETLSTRLYRLSSDERLAEASTSALIMVVLGMVAVFWLKRVSDP